MTAPKDQIAQHKLHELLSKDSIIEKVEKRVLGYYGKSTQNCEQWLKHYFMPLMDRIKIEAINWESIISYIKELDPVSGEEISRFYDYCLKFN